MTLEGFDSIAFSHEDTCREVFRRGSGPGVVVMHEIPGITPQDAEFAERVADEGFTVYLPHLFGAPRKPLSRAHMGPELARAKRVSSPTPAAHEGVS